MNFQINQALYSTNGRKIGWVVGINEGTGSAQVKPCNGEAAMVIPVSDLISGAVKTRSDLRNQQIPRTSPRLILPGHRLWEGPMYRGAITKIIHRDVISHDYVCHTDLSQAVGSTDIYSGKITVGRRSHPNA